MQEFIGWNELGPGNCDIQNTANQILVLLTTY